VILKASRALSIPVALRVDGLVVREEEGSSLSIEAKAAERPRDTGAGFVAFEPALGLTLTVLSEASSAASSASRSAFLAAASCFLASAASL